VAAVKGEPRRGGPCGNAGVERRRGVISPGRPSMLCASASASTVLPLW
jgi:hypothetical protein